MTELPSRVSPGETQKTTIETYIEGPRHSLEACRKATKDRQDGTILLSFEIEPKDIPMAFQASPSGSLWRITFPEKNTHNEEIYINVVRHDIADGKSGKVILRFITIPGRTPPEIFWGKTNEKITIGISSLAGQHPFPHFIDRAERMSVLKRISILCAEPEFQTWIKDQAVKSGFPEIPIPTETFCEEAELSLAAAKEFTAAENMCRIASLDTRRDILTSSRAAERVENIIRTWRATLRTEQRNKQNYQN